ncbi:aldehyde dehydrogenase family protein [Candidatus Spongiisocius sp.]|uniref:aldehyde dehydrogenase family protein n=1 Tax=Candidatus Spongiisocius sp. TaxID=3101273 RepID=UPI003B5A7659
MDRVGKNSIEVIDPATEQVITRLPSAGPEDADRAVARAKAAFATWQNVAAGDRATILRRVGAAVEEQAVSLAQLESRNVGKPINDALGEVGMVAATFAYYAGSPERLTGKTIPVPGGVNMTFKEPMGVVGLITPWNFPLAIASWGVAPALAAGNTVVLKPAQLTPLTAIELERIALEAGLPEGVFQVLAGPGSLVGERLVEHPDVAKIGFTGSTEVGKRISIRASETIKRVTLELGGKSANIVFADADLERAAAAAPGAVFGNAGQDCCARSRILVERSTMDVFLDLLSANVAAMRVGDPMDEATEMGPLITAEHRSKVASFLDEDTTVVARGNAPDGPGFWFAPTVVTPNSPGARAATEEIFGPIACVMPFDDEEEAVSIANDTIYGLSGSVWTENGARALRVARALDAGTLSVNSNWSVRIATPYGGFKQSGIGRALGPDALDYYTELKNLYIAT